MTTTTKQLDEKQRNELIETYNAIGSGLTFADQILFPEEQRFMRSFDLKERLQRMYPEDASQISDEDFAKELYELDIFISRLENRLYQNYQDSPAIPFIHVSLKALRDLRNITGLEMRDRWFSVKAEYSPDEAARIIRELVIDINEYLTQLTGRTESYETRAQLEELFEFTHSLDSVSELLDDGIEPAVLIPTALDQADSLKARILKFPLEEILHIQGMLSRLTQIEMVAKQIGVKNEGTL